MAKSLRSCLNGLIVEDYQFEYSNFIKLQLEYPQKPMCRLWELSSKNNTQMKQLE